MPRSLRLLAELYDVQLPPPGTSDEVIDQAIRDALVSRFYHVRNKRPNKHYYIRWFENDVHGKRALTQIDECLKWDIFSTLSWGDVDAFYPTCFREEDIYAELMEEEGAFDEDFDPLDPVEPIQINCTIRPSSDETVDEPCPICFDAIPSACLVTLNCAHATCSTCISGIFNIRSNRNHRCPLCRTEITNICVQDSDETRQLRQQFNTP